ncbi:MAG: o-succinylbenzoate--CoA ligase, partial [Chloroflexota bacterium]
KVSAKIARAIPSIHQLSTAKDQPSDISRQRPITSLQAIVFTSGTTGRPKAVPITFDQHFYSAMGSAYRLGVQTNDIWLSVLPLYHVGGLAVIFRSTLYGTAVDLHPRFDLIEINQALDDKAITMISVVPTMLYRMIEIRERWPDSLRLILVGGAAASPELVEAAGGIAQDSRPLISTTYGMTEAASQFVTQTPANTALKPGSVGKPLLFNQLKIVDDAGSEQPIHTYGEIWAKGPVLMSGYLDHPAANAERFVDGWFRTGDIGMLDEEGDLFVIQRRSDLIISGGENVYPAEVEAALRHHPAVKEACVVGILNPEWGEIVAAMVELIPQQQVDEAELIAYSRQHLAGYKQPRRIDFVEELPQTASGKIERKRVKALMQAS